MLHAFCPPRVGIGFDATIDSPGKWNNHLYQIHPFLTNLSKKDMGAPLSGPMTSSFGGLIKWAPDFV